MQRKIILIYDDLESAEELRDAIYAYSSAESISVELLNYLVVYDRIEIFSSKGSVEVLALFCSEVELEKKLASIGRNHIGNLYLISGEKILNAALEQSIKLGFYRRYPYLGIELDQFLNFLFPIKNSTYNLDTIVNNLLGYIFNSDEIIWTLDLNLKPTFYNPRFKEFILNSSPEYNFDSTILNASTDDESREYWSNVFQKTLEGNKVEEYLFSGKNFFQLSLLPLYKEGEVEGILGTMSDLTGLHRLQENAVSTRDRLELAVDSMSLGVFEWNLRTNEVIWNRYMYDIYGVDKDTFKLNYRNWLRLIEPEYRNSVFKKRLEIHDPDSLDDYVFRAVRPDGKKTWLQPTGKIYYNEYGKPEKMIGLTMDVTEREETKRELLASKEKLENLIDDKIDELNNEIELRTLAEKELEVALDRQIMFNKEKNRFVQMLSHEFRTPLTQISMSSDILSILSDKSEEKKIVKAEKHSGIIRSGLKQITDMLSAASNYFELQDLLGRPEIEYIDIFRLVTDIRNELINYEYKNRIINIQNSLSTPKIFFDRMILRTSIRQLLTNSIQFSKPDTEIDIYIEDREDELSGAIIRIVDKGMGIPEEDMSKVKELFTKASNTMNLGDQRGLGIGLAAVSASMDSLLSTLTLNSKLGEGTEAILTLKSIE
ncbi:MAG: hypothetical protein Kapaf2KO_22020 [Candidatus Kapaibacteriales bacterium]